MNSQPPISSSPRTQEGIRSEPGVTLIRNINWPGTKALYLKEVRRFMKVQLQTIWAPSISQILFLVVFLLALGGAGRTVALRGVHVPFADFIAPGLIMMGMINASFANSSFSLLVGKVQGTMVDYLMPPISTAEMLFALVASSVTRALMVGAVLWATMQLFTGVSLIPVHLWAALFFAVAGPTFVAFIGVMTSIWAEKFDHAAAITNFVIGPAALLSGTFYSIDRLPPLFQTISHGNPFFYAISGFRYAFVAAADTDVGVGVGVLIALNVALGFVTLRLLRSGWKIKP
ncbi:MAG: ABC transporter permease [Sphingobium sp.]|nr:ABC transporter permease [Sphingobium sp.]